MCTSNAKLPVGAGAASKFELRQLLSPAGDNSARVPLAHRGLPSPLSTSGSPPLGEADAEASASGVMPAPPAPPVPSGGLLGARAGPDVLEAFATGAPLAGWGLFPA